MDTGPSDAEIRLGQRFFGNLKMAATPVKLAL
jgi:hypothetical protein